MRISSITPRKWAVCFLLGIVFLMFIASLNSCITQNRRARICATCPIVTDVVTIKDSSYTNSKIVHDTVYTSVPGPTLTLDNPCSHLCDSAGRLKKFNLETKKNGIKQRLYTDTVNNKLIQDCNEDSLLRVNEKLIIENTHLRIEKEVKTLPPVEINILTWWQKLMIKCGYLFWILLLSVVGYKVFKLYIKIP